MRTICLCLLLLTLSGVLSAQKDDANPKKLELELSVSESINTSLNFKFGRSRIYGIVSGGIVRFDNLRNSAIGLGLGTQQSRGKGWTNEIELLAYTMNRDGDFSGDLSMLTQLRLTAGKQLTSRFKLYCGPVLNMSFLKNKDVDGRFSNDIAPYSIWSNEKDNFKMNGWIGIAGGIRF